MIRYERDFTFARHPLRTAVTCFVRGQLTERPVSREEEQAGIVTMAAADEDDAPIRRGDWEFYNERPCLRSADVMLQTHRLYDSLTSVAQT